jgi:NAD(P)-dependent dehydrogenase (short-subunit alcohol dehydrogenase family)
VSAPVGLITGAANGIGAAVARRLCSEGYDLILLDHDGANLEAVAEPLRASCRVVASTVDLRSSQDVDEAIHAGVDHLGRLDAVVTCAGVNAYFDAVDMTETEWDDVFDIDLKATWLTCRAALPALTSSPRASIVTVSSIHSVLTTAGMFPYAAAKAGVEGLTRSLALDYGPAGVRVNAVAPGWTRTRLVEEWLARQDDPAAALDGINQAHPLRRIADPSEVAAVIAFLAGEASRAVTGATFRVDCGLSARFATN